MQFTLGHCVKLGKMWCAIRGLGMRVFSVWYFKPGASRCGYIFTCAKENAMRCDVGSVKGCGNARRF